MYDDDFYGELSEFEQQIDEFKQSLINAVKKEYQDEMERLRKENAELQGIKKRKKEIEAEHSRALRQFATDKESYERQTKKARITELLGEFMLTGWFPSADRIKKPKCDKCDENRRIFYTKPSGKKDYEICSCSEPLFVYHPEEIHCYEFSQYKNSRWDDTLGVSLYFKREESKDYDTFEKGRNVYSGEPFEKVQSYKIVFFKQDDCQRYCDWKNAQAKEANI